MRLAHEDEQGRLHAMALSLWPDDSYLYFEWLRAVHVVRSTSKGWLLDRIPHAVPVPQSNIIFMEHRS